MAAESDDLVSEPDADPVDDDAPGHGEERAARFADEFARLAAGDGVPRAWAWSLAYVLAGFGNFFLRRPFVSNAVFGVAVFTTLAAFIIFNFTKQM